MIQAVDGVTGSTRRMTFRVAALSIVVEARDPWAAQAIDALFAGWYLCPETAIPEAASSPAIVIGSEARPPKIPRGWSRFEIAGGGTCFTDGHTSSIDIEGSIVVSGRPDDAVQVWINGRLEIPSPALTRIVTYALSAALRRRRLFELHSGAVIDPASGQGVLIVGPSGSGKSTLTVQLAAAGWSFLTDDVLALSPDGVEVTAWPLRRCFAITFETFAASTLLQARAALDYREAPRDAKKEFMPHGVFDSEFGERCVPRTLFFSQLDGGEWSRVCPLSSAEAMARLIRMNPWSCYDRWTAAEHLGVLSALVRQSRSYALIAGRDLLEPDTAARLIAGV